MPEIRGEIDEQPMGEAHPRQRGRHGATLLVHVGGVARHIGVDAGDGERPGALGHPVPPQRGADVVAHPLAGAEREPGGDALPLLDALDGQLHHIPPR
ncbi:MAG: hypothetical protein R2695_01830 [Acidimicrobiales bacterium]